ncbi:hypothetical protein GCM10011581_00270 [Saccharopolyspora subtropica]|uniref:Uncharacterized protein n=1 Tax=Saccharopolyspora thermophila TaxID=89367 RepID=A0A917N684_9PSEU|nr:hypothetical protein [Saccharopolyspora subtropica]GGI67405.1 hypothetical protein GCM10011581_00270 [Saccharopolyspora subtropica]
MIRLAITGHRELSAETSRIVDVALRQEIARYSPDDLVGTSCLADGADSFLAKAILEHGGKLVTVVPAAEYRIGLPSEHHSIYDDLFRQSSKVIKLDHVKSDSRAHMDGSLRMIEEADAMLAVWDGKPARGYGGTADIVEAARNKGLPVTVIWPEGASRE